jgi:transposase
MTSSIAPLIRQHKTLLHLYRHHADPEVPHRAHILLLLADGYTGDTIAAILFTSASTIARWQQRFRQGGLFALAGQTPGRRSPFRAYWPNVIATCLSQHAPRDFGFLRSRWTCAVVVVLLWRWYQLAVSGETVRRWLHIADLVWRRPRPVVRRPDPLRQAKLRALRRLVSGLPADETAVFQDEVDVNLNPKIGSMWMRRGQQAEGVLEAWVRAEGGAGAGRACAAGRNRPWSERIEGGIFPNPPRI